VGPSIFFYFPLFRRPNPADSALDSVVVMAQRERVPPKAAAAGDVALEMGGATGGERASERQGWPTATIHCTKCGASGCWGRRPPARPPSPAAPTATVPLPAGYRVTESRGGVLETRDAVWMASSRPTGSLLPLTRRQWWRSARPTQSCSRRTGRHGSHGSQVRFRACDGERRGCACGLLPLRKLRCACGLLFSIHLHRCSKLLPSLRSPPSKSKQASSFSYHNRHPTAFYPFLPAVILASTIIGTSIQATS
jgi:hypothetical protein